MLDKYVALKVKNPTIHLWPEIGFLVYREKINQPSNVIAFNLSGIEILSLCNGLRTIHDIATYLAKLYKADYEKTANQILNFFQAIDRTEFVVFSKGPKPTNLKITGSKDYMIPLHAAVELTYTCNLRCQHCYISSGPENTEQMELGKIIKLFDIFEGWGIRSIELTGGEPMSHPNFAEILQIASNRFDLIGVVTNGTLFNDSILQIMAAKPENFMVQIDLDGVIPDYVDWFRGGSNVYSRELESIRQVVHHKILIRVSMTVTPDNLDQVKQTAELVKNLGVTSFGASPIIPQGRGGDKSLLLSHSEYEKFISSWNNLREEYQDFIFQNRESPFQTIKGNCGAGSRTITITPLGDVKICAMSTPSTFCFGNIFTSTAKELFGNASNAMSKIEPPSEEICGDCKHFGFCINCLHRGTMKAREIHPNNCLWYQKYQNLLEMETAHDS